MTARHVQAIYKQIWEIERRIPAAKSARGAARMADQIAALTSDIPDAREKDGASKETADRWKAAVVEALTASKTALTASQVHDAVLDEHDVTVHSIRLYLRQQRKLGKIGSAPVPTGVRGFERKTLQWTMVG